MKIFSEKHQELKDFEEVILDIEKERGTIDWCHASIRSCLWNLESPKIEQFDKDYFVKDLRENYNKKEKAQAKLEYLKHSKLRSEMFRLNITTTPDRFLDWLDDMKKQKGINNFWKEEQYKEWREDIKKHLNPKKKTEGLASILGVKV